MTNRKEEVLVSIIVPIYNVEKFLPICVDSLLQQKYKNIEILLIDDGSLDDCSNICDEYANKDSRVKVYHKRNGGLSDARNYGISKANGSYITFVDSDDYINKNYISLLLEATLIHEADIAICDFIEVVESDSEYKSYKKNNPVIMSGNECIHDTYRPRVHGMTFVTWGKIYNCELFKKNHIDFPVGKIHEDTFTTYKLFYYSKKIVFLNSELYYYRQRQGSIMNTDFSLNRLDRLQAMEEACEFFTKYKEYNLLGDALNTELRECIKLFEEVKHLKNKSELYIILDNIRDIYIRELHKYINLASLPSIKKLFYKAVPIIKLHNAKR